jgi:hypothetical protein
VRIAARCCADHVVVTRLAAGLAQERRYPAIRRDRSCRDWIGLLLHSQLISAISPGCHGGPATRRAITTLVRSDHGEA